MKISINGKKQIRRGALLLSCLGALALGSAGRPADAAGIGSNIAMGYWDNWGTFTLENSPSEYKVLFYAFAEGSGTDGATIYMYQPSSTNPLSNLASDISACHSQGRKVVLSIGGANSANITLLSSTDVSNFVSSVESLVSTYGFDGIDLDLENSSVTVNAGDSLTSPSTPDLAYMGQALQQIASHFGSNLIITCVPETADIDAYGTYSGIWGSYLPLIDANKNVMSLVDIQCYDSGSMYAANGQVISEGGADFDVAMSELMLHGYTVSGGQQFPALAQQQVAFGNLVGTNTPSIAVSAWDYLTKGESDGGSYKLLGGPYGSAAGMMVWDINTDVADGDPWANAFSSAGLTGVASGGGTTGGGTTGGGTTGGTTGAPSNGVHTLTPACATGVGLDDAYLDTANGAPVEIYALNKSDSAEQWNFANVGGSSYNLAINVGPYCLDDNGGSSGTAVQLWACSGDTNQKWTFNSVTGGYNVVNGAGLCLNDWDASSSNFAPVKSYPCSSGDQASIWMLDYTPPTVSNGIHELTPAAASGVALDDPYLDTANGSKVEIYQFNSTDTAEQWNFANIGGNNYNLAISAGPYCLDDNGGSNGTDVQLWSCEGDTNQQWTFNAVTGGFNVVNGAGLCLNDWGASSTNFSPVVSYPCESGDQASIWVVH